MTRPELQRGDHVEVVEDGIDPWRGTVLSVKPSKNAGWWVEVNRDGGNGKEMWAICLANGTTVTKIGGGK